MWQSCLGKKMLLGGKKGVPGAHHTVLLFHSLCIYWMFYFYSFLFFSFQMSNTGTVALEYTWRAAVEEERAVILTGELLPPSLDGKAPALCGNWACPGCFSWQMRSWGEDHASSPQNMNCIFILIQSSTFISIFPDAAGDFLLAPLSAFQTILCLL